MGVLSLTDTGWVLSPLALAEAMANQPARIDMAATLCVPYVLRCDPGR